MKSYKGKLVNLMPCLGLTRYIKNRHGDAFVAVSGLFYASHELVAHAGYTRLANAKVFEHVFTVVPNSVTWSYLPKDAEDEDENWVDAGEYTEAAVREYNAERIKTKLSVVETVLNAPVLTTDTLYTFGGQGEPFLRYHSKTGKPYCLKSGLKLWHLNEFYVTKEKPPTSHRASKHIIASIQTNLQTACENTSNNAV